MRQSDLRRFLLRGTAYSKEIPLINKVRVTKPRNRQMATQASSRAWGRGSDLSCDRIRKGPLGDMLCGLRRSKRRLQPPDLHRLLNELVASVLQYTTTKQCVNTYKTAAHVISIRTGTAASSP